MADITEKPSVVEVEAPQHVRFSELPWYDPKFGPGWITVGGAGGIGSWLCLILSRAGYSLHIWDFDSVDETNLGGQLYYSMSTGVRKSSAIRDVCRMFGAEQHISDDDRFTADSIVSPICFAAFDNMAARKLMFETWVKAVKDTNEPAVFIDGRMLAESGHVYVVTRNEIDAYRTQLFDDSEVKDQPCSAKATSHCGAFIASLLMASFTNWVTNCKLEMDAREVPFKVEFGLALMSFKLKTTEECIQ